MFVARQEQAVQDQTQPPTQPGPEQATGATGATGGTGPTGPTGYTGMLPTVKARTEQAASEAAMLARKYLPSGIGVVIILLIAWFLASWARRAARLGLTRARFDPTLGKFLSNLLRWLILTLAILTCLNLFGIEQTSFAAILGATGLAVGLALQGSLANLAAGVMLLIFRPFKVGDWVIAAGQPGKVNEIDLFQTTLDTADGRRVIVPNGPIFGGTIENSTYHPRRRVDVVFTVQLGPSIDATRRALERAVKRGPDILRDCPIDLVPTGFPVAGVDWLVSVWARTEKLAAVRAELVEAIKEELDKDEIPLKR